ncbi:MAG: hypothetical protein ABEK04_04190 [Candidatus Nanohalobium sp.]
MEVDFEGEPYPTEDERIHFGYHPNQIYIMDDSSKEPSEKHRFRGSSVEEVLEEMRDAYLGFEYVNGELLMDEQDAEGLKEVPVFQYEAVPAELRPGEEWIETFREIEDMNHDVADTSFTVTFYNNERAVEVDMLDDELENASLTAFPDIRGVQLVSYWPQTQQANLIQYNNEVSVPVEPLGGERVGIDPDQKFRTVEYPRDEASIRELLENHSDWEITRNTLPKNEIPPEIYAQETGERR